ncbi:MAG: hypothetical protein IJE72_06125 [Clostridia bacterium]|nr:hypothetical protein [Clostridia bacterium]
MLEKAIKVAVKEGVKEKALSPNEKLIKANKGDVSFSGKKDVEKAVSNYNTQANMVKHNLAIGQTGLAKSAAAHLPSLAKEVEKAKKK